MSDIEELKNKINNSELFNLDPILDQNKYERKKYELVEMIYRYEEEVLKNYNKKVEDFSLEIVETFERVIKSFKPSIGTDFINYFSKSIINEIKKAEAISKYENQSRGLKMSKKEKENGKKINSYLRKHPGYKIEDLWNDIDNVAECMGMSPEELEEAISDYTYTLVEDYESIITDKNENGDSENDKSKEKTSARNNEGQDIDSHIQLVEFFSRLMDKYSELFKTKRGKSKQIISIYLTSFFTIEVSEESWDELLKKQNFFNPEIYEIVCKSDKTIKNKEISLRTGTTEANVSKTIQKFKNAIHFECADLIKEYR